MRVSCLLLCLLLALPIAAGAEEDEGKDNEPKKWSVSLYGGLATGQSIPDILFWNPEFEASYVGVIALSRVIWIQKSDLLQAELEAQFAQHFEWQDHQEVNGAFVLRWLKFPWDRYVDTSIAAGGGVSYATEEPPIEIRYHETTEKSLCYLLFEIELGPEDADWSTFVRIHHRSAIFGTMGEKQAISNVLGFGLRYDF